MGIRPQIQGFLTFQTILFFLTYSRLSWYVNYRKELVAILNAQSGGCMPQSTCRACVVKILKRWVQKIAGVPPLYSAYSLSLHYNFQTCLKGRIHSYAQFKRIMNNVNSEELGRVVASAVASYLQPNSQLRQRRNEGNSTVDVPQNNTSGLVECYARSGKNCTSLYL